MNMRLSCALAALLAFQALPAEAVVSLPGGLLDNLGNSNLGISSSGTNDANGVGSALLNFNWSVNDAFTGTLDFTTTLGGTLSLDGYLVDPAETNALGQQSGLFVISDFGGSAETTLTSGSTTACVGASLGLGALACDLIQPTGTTNDGFGTSVALFVLAPGDYTVGLFDSASPEFGSIRLSFVESAVIPLPAPALLLLSGLAGLGLMRRVG
ncbi:MAG: hypothetical protein AAGI34_00565 [Pseudomonadota bacterium]